MIIDRIRQLLGIVAAHTDQTSEHEAVVDLLLLTACCDHRVSQAERRALEAFDADHAGWDEADFSVGQYLPASFSKVRAALGEPGGTERLLIDAAARLTTPAARSQALDACRSLASTEGVDADEAGFLAQVQTALA